MGVPFANGSPSLTVDTPAMVELVLKGIMLLLREKILRPVKL
ncbi:MAG: hypothetical protein CM1200mP16_15120 [Nitrospina sp.]|nr:MAG: hypothetical protein CM1200mP16_15120 [Nitrospina sp.]